MTCNKIYFAGVSVLEEMINEIWYRFETIETLVSYSSVQQISTFFECIDLCISDTSFVGFHYTADLMLCTMLTDSGSSNSLQVFHESAADLVYLRVFLNTSLALG